jgi:hypothetical protein
MARLLRDLDYLRVIHTDNIDTIIESNEQIKLDVEQSAQAEMISYLAQRYKVREVFSDTTVFDDTVTYKGKNLIEYTAPAFDTTTTYGAADRRTHKGYLYESIAGSTPHAFVASEWTKICADKALFYAKLPQTEYNPDTKYAVGDKVWFEDSVYTCAKKCTNIDPSNSEFWGTGTPYSFSGFLPDNTTYWTAGDNRNQQIVLFLIDITLYHLHSRINPRNIPDLRKERYNGNGPNDSGGAIGWLKAVAHGNVQADLPVYTPQQGLSMRYGNSATFDGPSTNMMW